MTGGSFGTFRAKGTVSSGNATPGFSTLKMLRTCQFCRKRKIKCVIVPGQITCENCKKHGIICKSDYSQIDSNKFATARKSTVNCIQSVLEDTSVDRVVVEGTGPIDNKEVSESFLYNPSSPSTLLMMVPSLFRRWNLLSTPHGSTYAAKSPQMSYPQVMSEEGSLELYHLKVEPSTPFLPKFGTLVTDRFCNWCIRVAADENPQAASDSSECSVGPLVTEEFDWTPTALGCLFILPLYMNVPSVTLSGVFSQFHKWIEDNPDVILNPDPNLFAGAMVVDAWTSLIRESPLQTDLASLNVLDQFTDVDKSSFSYRMITLGLMVYDFLSVLSDVSEAANDSVFWASKRRSLLSFEYEMLIFPIKLSLELSVVSDNVQSSSEALMLHLLGNTLMIAYYGTAALKKGEYGRNLSLYPVPGLYLFIAGIATSNFIVGPRIRDHWGIVAECEIFTARYLLALNREMPFEDFKPSLYLFLRDRTLKVFQTPEAQSLFDEASSLLAGKSYPDNPPDAAAVYWVFSDTRRMTLELYLSN